MKEPLAGANGRGKPLSRRGCYSRCGRATGREKDLAIEFAAFIVLALALWFKHSYDADHLVAVSNLITRSGSIRKTSLISVSWAAGHMVTAAIITVLLYAFRQTILSDVLAHLDLLVAVMLLLIGVIGLLWAFNVLHVHEHWHGLVQHRHFHTWLHGHLTKHGEHKTMFSIGIVHGLASNDEQDLAERCQLRAGYHGGRLLDVAAAMLCVSVIRGAAWAGRSAQGVGGNDLP